MKWGGGGEPFTLLAAFVGRGQMSVPARNGISASIYLSLATVTLMMAANHSGNRNRDRNILHPSPIVNNRGSSGCSLKFAETTLEIWCAGVFIAGEAPTQLKRLPL